MDSGQLSAGCSIRSRASTRARLGGVSWGDVLKPEIGVEHRSLGLVTLSLRLASWMQLWMRYVKIDILVLFRSIKKIYFNIWSHKMGPKMYKYKVKWDKGHIESLTNCL